MKHAKKLTVNGRGYKLVEPYKSLGNGISEGPLYATIPKQDGVLWMPDVAYVQGTRARPTEMHRITLVAPSNKSSRRRRQD